MSSGPCPPDASPTPTPTTTPTTTPTPTPSFGVTPNVTPTSSLTPTPTPTINPCENVGAVILTGGTISPSPTPSPTPSPSPGSKITVTGATNYYINEGFFECGDVAELIGCDESNVYYVNSPIIFTGSSVTTGTTLNVTVNGETLCVYYNQNINGSSTHVLNSINSIVADCNSCDITPTPTPSITNTPTVTPTPSSTPPRTQFYSIGTNFFSVKPLSITACNLYNGGSPGSTTYYSTVDETTFFGCPTGYTVYSYSSTFNNYIPVVNGFIVRDSLSSYGGCWIEINNSGGTNGQVVDYGSCLGASCGNVGNNC